MLSISKQNAFVDIDNKYLIMDINFYIQQRKIMKKLIKYCITNLNFTLTNLRNLHTLYNNSFTYFDDKLEEYIRYILNYLGIIIELRRSS